MHHWAGRAFAFTSPLLGLSLLHADNGTWSRNGDANAALWSETANWSSGRVADGAGFYAVFSALNLTGQTRTVTLDSTRTLGSWFVGDNNTTARFGYIFEALPDQAIHFDNLGQASQLVQVSTSAATVIKAPIFLHNDLELFNHVPESNHVLETNYALRLQGDIQAAVSKDLTLRLGNFVPTSTSTSPLSRSTTAGVVAISGKISNGEGVVSVVVDTPTGGTLLLSGDNTYSGGTTLRDGVLELGSSTALGTGVTTIEGGVISAKTSVTLTRSYVLSGDFTYQGTVTGTIGNNASHRMTQDITVSVVPNSGTSVNQLNLHGAISDEGNNYAITKTGMGSLYMSGSSTFTGGLNVLGGGSCWCLRAAVWDPSGSSMAPAFPTMPMPLAPPLTKSAN